MIALLLAAELVLAHGGELEGPPSATVERTGDDVVAWGFVEVPGGSRLQAALAMADAGARAQLISAVRASVTAVHEDVQTEAGQSVADATREVEHGLLPALAPPQHGWRKLERDGVTVLQCWARVTAVRSVLETALARGLKNEKRARAALDRIGSKR